MNDRTGSRPAPMRGGIFLAAALALAGCATQGGGTSSSGMSARTGASAAGSNAAMKIASDGSALWNSRNLQELAKGYAPNATFSSPLMPGPVPVKEMFDSLQSLFAAVPDAKIQVLSAAPAGDNMVVEQWVVSGTWTAPFTNGPLAGIAPTGKQFSLPGATIYQLQDGKVVAETQYYDQLTYLAQLGMVRRQ